MQLDSAESAGGRLGAVLSAPRTGLVRLGAKGPWLASTPAVARQVLMDPVRFDFPGDVSRSGDLSGSTGETRSGHTVFAPLTPAQVAVGSTIFDLEWARVVAEHDRVAHGTPYDAMLALRLPVARSTAAAVLPSVEEESRNAIGDLTLTWIDALGPVIAARRPPARWSRKRRNEQIARVALEDALDALPDHGRSATQAATMLAAGIQVPIAAGSFLLAWIAQHSTRAVDPLNAVWETIRLTPPTWITPRITAEDVEIDGQVIPAGRVILVSPLLLGRFPDLVPGEPAELDRFSPQRWEGTRRRPGAWLPFGAGPHACPGRTLGLAQLVSLATWALSREITLSERAGIDQSRGIFPAPCRFTVSARRKASP